MTVALHHHHWHARSPVARYKWTTVYIAVVCTVILILILMGY